MLNYSTPAVGFIKVELQDELSRPVPGFSLDVCPEIYGDQVERVVSWKAGNDLSKLAGKKVRLKFQMKDADLYSERASDSVLGSRSAGFIQPHDPVSSQYRPQPC